MSNLKERESGRQTRIDFLRAVREHWFWVAPLSYLYVSAYGLVASWHRFDAFGINVIEFSEFSDLVIAAFREPVSFFMFLILVMYGFLYILVLRQLEIRGSVFSRGGKFVDSQIHVRLKAIHDRLARQYEHGYASRLMFRLVTWAFYEILHGENSSSHRSQVMLRRRKVKNGLFKLIYCYIFLAVILLPYLVPTYLDRYDDEWKKSFLSDPANKVDVWLTSEEYRGSKATPMSDLFLIGSTSKFIFLFDDKTRKSIIILSSNLLRIDKKG